MNPSTLLNKDSAVRLLRSLILQVITGLVTFKNVDVLSFKKELCSFERARRYVLVQTKKELKMYLVLKLPISE